MGIEQRVIAQSMERPSKTLGSRIYGQFLPRFRLYGQSVIWSFRILGSILAGPDADDVSGTHCTIAKEAPDQPLTQHSCSVQQGTYTIVLVPKEFLGW